MTVANPLETIRRGAVEIITEDDLRKMETEVQKLTDEFIAKVDQSVSHKEKEIMEV